MLYIPCLSFDICCRFSCLCHSMRILGGLQKKMIKIKPKTKEVKKERIMRIHGKWKKMTKKGVGKNNWSRQGRRCFLCLKISFLSIFLFQSFLPNMIKFSKQSLVSWSCYIQVAADYKAVAYTPDVLERRRMQTETLSAVFETYFRILKHTMQSSAARFVVHHISWTSKLSYRMSLV